MKLPTSFRLPAELLNKLKIMSENSNKSVSDIVCNALINNFENENYVRKNLYELLKDPVKSYISIYKKLQNIKNTPNRCLLDIAEIKFILLKIHDAYSRSLNNTVSQYYFEILLDISYELIQYSKKEKILFDEYYVYKYLDLKQNQMINLDDLKQSFSESCNAGYAEMLLRPLSSNAFDLEKYSLPFLGDLFNNQRLRQLLPIVATGVRKDNDNLKIDEIQTEIVVLISNINLLLDKIGGFDFRIQCLGNITNYQITPSICLLIECKKFILPLNVNELLSLLRVCKSYIKSNYSCHQIKSDNISLLFNINDGYYCLQINSMRIFFEEMDFNKLIRMMVELDSNSLVKDHICFFKQIYGDI